MWPWLILLAALLLPFDIAVRRLILTRQDWVRIRNWLSETLLPHRIPEPVAPPTPHMQALFKAKDRAHSDTPSGSSPALMEVPPVQPPASPAEKMDEPKAEPVLQNPSPSQPDTTTTGSLLARKKELRKKRE